jgi:ubiquinone biosynthesis monooxygenase Coq7
MDCRQHQRAHAQTPERRASLCFRFVHAAQSAQRAMSSELGDRIIKVDHAGEQGAICIYTGQILMARITARHMRAELVEFRSHETRHRAIFAAELQRRNRPRCRSYWFCAIGGYVLGVVTGLMGASAIAATTVAVESVVLRHLEQQLHQLQDADPAALAAISAIIADEKEHHARSASHVASHPFWSRVITPIVSASTEAVIWLGMRL